MAQPVFIARVRGRGFRWMLAGILAATLAITMGFVPVVQVMNTLAGDPEPLRTAAERARFLEIWAGMWPLAPFVTLFVLAGGLPAHLLLAALRRQGFGPFILAGAVGGAAVLELVLNAARDPWEAKAPLMGAVFGALAALVFRAVWRPARSG